MKDFDWVLGKSRGKGRLIIDHLPLEQAFDCLYVTSYVENVGCSYGYLCTSFIMSQVKKEIDARGMRNQPRLLETCKANLAKETCQPKQEYTLLKEWLSQVKQKEGKRSTLSHIEVDFANFAHVLFKKEPVSSS